jgi:GNAT superfamily N-acetyltransferase
MPRATIRPIGSLAELAEAFNLAGAQFDPPVNARDATRTYLDLADRFDDDRSLMLCADHEGSLVGAALAFRAAPTQLTLRMLAVVSGARGEGVGRALVEMVEQHARDVGATRIDLGADAEADFYLHLGYNADLFLQWAFDATRYNEEVDALVRGPLAGMNAWRTSYEGIPQLRAHLTRVDREFRDHIESLVTGCHVGFVMAKELVPA